MKTYTDKEIEEMNKKYKEGLVAERRGGMTHEWLYSWTSYFPEDSITLTLEEARALVWEYEGVMESYEKELRHASDY